MDSKSGKQTGGCQVTSCKYNCRGTDCDLNRIEVRPACNCNSGEANESLCGSYTHKMDD